MGLRPPATPPQTVARRVLLSALLTTALLACACAALFVTAAPAALSLLIEPVSLLLTPGLLLALAIAGHHDFAATHVIVGSAVFYFAFFYAVLALRARRGNRHSR